MIPEMTDRLGRYWDQPDRSEILVDGTHAVMTQATLVKLHDYSRSQPSGCYGGKMWKARDPGGPWYLNWFGPSRKPNHCSVNIREILVVR